MPVKTMPLNAEMLDGQTPAQFFGVTLPARQRGNFYVIGRHYIAKDAAPGTLVLFHHDGSVVAHARLRADWKQANDDPKTHPLAVAVYLFEEITVLSNPLRVNDLPGVWQASWKKGHFDQSPRTLDDAHEAEFLKGAT